MSALSETFLQCARAVSAGSLPDCKPLGFNVADWLTIIVSLGTILGGLYWAATRLFHQLSKSGSGTIRSFKALRKAIQPLMDDNYRIFSQFGPNSGAKAKGDVRFDLSVWKRARNRIGANNREIAQLIHGSLDLVSPQHRKTFREWLSHIDAFAAHLEDDRVDYRNHQFPAKIPDIIKHG